MHHRQALSHDGAPIRARRSKSGHVCTLTAWCLHCLPQTQNRNRSNFPYSPPNKKIPYSPPNKKSNARVARGTMALPTPNQNADMMVDDEDDTVSHARRQREETQNHSGSSHRS